MMKLYISADMEGIAGLTEYRHASPGSTEFFWMLDLWMDQINTIIGAAIDEGVDEVLVNEAHSGMNYFNIGKLNSRASLISGYIKADNQMHGLDESYLGAVFLGHARAGTGNAVLNHTYVMRDVCDIRLNGESIGEIGLNGYWALYLGSALIMVVGDDYAAREAKEFDRNIECAVVKEGVSQFSAVHIPYKDVKTELEETIRQAIQKQQMGAKPEITLPDRFVMEIDFSISEIAHLCSFVPGVEKIGSRSIRFENKDYRALQQTRIVCTNLALSVTKTHFQ
jgi:D-amino peptidase